MKPLHCISCMLLFMLLSQFCICYLWMRGRRDSLMTPLSKGEKIFQDVCKGRRNEVRGEEMLKWHFLKNDDHSEGEYHICILLFLLTFLNLNCNSWILTMIEGHIEQLFFQMDLKWDFWPNSGKWSFHAFFCLISLADAILKPAWSFPVLSFAFGPSCAFARKQRVISFRTPTHSSSLIQGLCGYHADMLTIFRWCYNWQWYVWFVVSRVFGKV